MSVPWSEPFSRFHALYEEAKTAQPKDPNAMSLATVDSAGRPSLRVVLLKEFDERGFVFYTNHQSRKGREAIGSPWAALNFHWPSLDVQVRIEGTLSQVDTREADAYFATRPRDSQIGAWASLQSEPLPSRAELERRVEALTTKHAGAQVPRPPHWGGFRLAPVHFEFWKAHPHRLHWRETYDRMETGWQTGQLYP